MKSATSGESASVLGCVIVGLIMEGNYPNKMYTQLFHCEKMKHLFENMRDEELLMLRTIIQEM